MDFSERLELVLQMSDVLHLWPEKYLNKLNKKAAFKMLIQDRNLFPNWINSPIKLETATIHTILVS